MKINSLIFSRRWSMVLSLVMMLGSIACWFAVSTSVVYLDSVQNVWTDPVGVVSIEKETISGKETYALISTFGKISRLEKYVIDPSTREPKLTQYWVYSYFDDGSHSFTNLYSADDKLLKEYDLISKSKSGDLYQLKEHMDKGIVLITWFNELGNRVLGPKSTWAQLQYLDQGRVVKLVNFDKDVKTSMQNDEGVTQITYKYINGIVRETTFLGASGEFTVELRDAAGRLSEIRYFYRSTPSTYNNSYHSRHYGYREGTDEHIYEFYEGVTGSRVPSDKGHCEWRGDYDDQGKLAVSRFFYGGECGELKEGTAYEVRLLFIDGKLYAKIFYDKEGNQIDNASKFSGVRYFFDSNSGRGVHAHFLADGRNLLHLKDH